MAKTFEEYLKEQNKLSADQLAKDKATYNSGFDTQIKNVTDNHNLLVKEMEEKYDLEQQANEVQKILNERQIAESNANMGTTDSGLNRTQMTAAQLSYANNKSRINQIKLKGLESLKLSLSQAVTGIEQDRRQTIAGLEADYAKNDRSNAVSLFNQQQQKAADIEAARIKAEEDSQKVDYTALKKVTSDILTEEQFKEKSRQITPKVGGSRGNVQTPKYYYNNKLYSTYADYVKDKLREHYDVFGTINEGTLAYLMDVYYKL